MYQKSAMRGIRSVITQNAACAAAICRWSQARLIIACFSESLEQIFYGEKSAVWFGYCAWFSDPLEKF